jgi:hypothetical protein
LRSGFASLAHSGEAGGCNQRESKDEDGRSDEAEVAVAEVFKEELGGDEDQCGIGDPVELSALNASTRKGQGKREDRDDKRADEGQMMGAGSKPDESEKLDEHGGEGDYGQDKREQGNDLEG